MVLTWGEFRERMVELGMPDRAEIRVRIWQAGGPAWYDVSTLGIDAAEPAWDVRSDSIPGGFITCEAEEIDDQIRACAADGIAVAVRPVVLVWITGG